MFANYEESKNNVKLARKSFCRSQNNQNRHAYTRYVNNPPTHPTPTHPVLLHAIWLQYCVQVSEDRKSISEDHKIVSEDRETVSEDRQIVSEE